MITKKFSPLLFLASLGAGGISVIPFAFINYTFSHPPGLIQASHIVYSELPMWQSILFRAGEGVMIVFALLHIVMSIALFVKLPKWLRSEGYKDFISDPLRNSNILAPFISVVMTLNVFIGPVRYFWPWMAENLQVMMAPALAAWAIIWALLMRMEIKLLKTSFESGFDVSKINFGWLLHPFALGMTTVTGMGIAAMATNPTVAHIAAFMSLISGAMGGFLLLVKLVALFKSQFASTGLPDRKFLPGFLIVIPNVTLYAISLFRFGHYLEKQHGFELGAYFAIVMAIAFAFETWYMMFGVSLLKDYFKKHFKKEFYVSQWGLVCPFVAYAVLGSFVHHEFVASPFFYWLVVVTTTFTVILFFDILFRQLSCFKGAKDPLRLNCK